MTGQNADDNFLVYPWRRAFARFTDYLLWGLLVSLFFTVMAGTEIYVLPIHLVKPVYFSAFVLYIFIEALFIAFFGTTPGKKILGIHVINTDGEKLCFAVSLKRAFLVFIQGMGLFLPVLSIIFPLFGWYYLKKNKTTPWDKSCRTKESNAKTGIIAKILLLVLYVFVFFGCLLSLDSLFNPSLQIPLIEKKITASYTRIIEPLLAEALSEKSLSTPQSVQMTLEQIERIQKIIQIYQDDAGIIDSEYQNELASAPPSKFKTEFLNELEQRNKRLKLFWFIQTTRIHLIENIVNFFEAAEGKYTFKNGKPVFDDPQLMTQYQNHIDRLDAFLKKAADSQNLETLQEQMQKKTTE